MNLDGETIQALTYPAQWPLALMRMYGQNLSMRGADAVDGGGVIRRTPEERKQKRNLCMRTAYRKEHPIKIHRCGTCGASYMHAKPGRPPKNCEKHRA